MDPKREKTLSKFLSLVLRHSPEQIGIVLDEAGWTPIEELLVQSAKHGQSFTRPALEFVVQNNAKQRFSISDCGTKIRANQGHSISVDLQLEPRIPPAELFHGTAERTLDAIWAAGLKKMARQHVHLSSNVDTATEVGRRYGKPVILVVDSSSMQSEGFTFYQSENGVWLNDHVPVRFLKQLT